MMKQNKSENAILMDTKVLIEWYFLKFYKFKGRPIFI